MPLVANFTDPLHHLPLNQDFWNLKSIQNYDKNISTHNFLNTTALSLTVYPGDIQMIGNDGKTTERVEIGENIENIVPFNIPLTYAFTIAFPPDFVISNNRLVFAQWKHIQSRTNPPVSLRYQNNQLIVCIKNDQEGTLRYKYDIDLRNKWTKFQIELCFTVTNHSYVRVKVNGDQILNFIGKTSFAGEKETSIFHTGIYRDAAPYSDTIFISNFERRIN